MKWPQTKFISTAIIFFSIALIPGCNRSKIISTEEERNQKEEIKATLVGMWQAIEEENVALYASYIHQDFTQFGENDSTLRMGKEAEVAGVTNWVNRYDSIHTEMSDARVTLRGDIAWITYYWQDRSIKDGQPFTSRGKSTRIFVRENNRWLCMHGHYTSLP
jgi:ketosteroid isomerase-like protein